MATFHVGQRVRIVRVTQRSEALAREATIEQIVGKAHWLVVDGLAADALGIWAEAWQLEPILPEGMESAEETLALWQPEGVRA